MSEYAPFSDAGVANDATDRSRTFISYYTYGAAVALALDLSIRELSANRQSLDDYMTLLWDTYGRPPDPRPGFVARPYSLRDLRASLAELTRNQPFADDFFDRFVEGREAADYERLLSRVGYVVRRSSPERGWIGAVAIEESSTGLVVGSGRGTGLVPFGTPLYEAGVDSGDVIVSIDGRPATRATWAAIGDRRPGDRVSLVVERRDGRRVTTRATLRTDPQIAIAPVESAGGELTEAASTFRRAWLGSRVP
jgi:predicted metalloprotease with PDZ domain